MQWHIQQPNCKWISFSCVFCVKLSNVQTESLLFFTSFIYHFDRIKCKHKSNSIRKNLWSFQQHHRYWTYWNNFNILALEICRKFEMFSHEYWSLNIFVLSNAIARLEIKTGGESFGETVGDFWFSNFQKWWAINFITFENQLYLVWTRFSTEASEKSNFGSPFDVFKLQNSLKKILERKYFELNLTPAYVCMLFFADKIQVRDLNRW